MLGHTFLSGIYALQPTIPIGNNLASQWKVETHAHFGCKIYVPNLCPKSTSRNIPRIGPTNNALTLFTINNMCRFRDDDHIQILSRNWSEINMELSGKRQNSLMMIALVAGLLLCTHCFSIDCPYSHSTVVKCVNRNLTSIPDSIPSNATLIDLSENPLLKLQKDSFARFSALKHLSLRYCNLNLPLELPNSLKIIDLEYNSFSVENVASMFRRKQEPRIISLHLEGNKLELDGNLSVFPKSVEHLWLDDNILQTIEAADFEAFTNLRHLSLGGNGLRNVASGAFDKLKQLTKFDLHNNKIRDLPKRIFQHNQQLITISLEQNHLRHIPDLSGVRRLNYLHLQKNQIQTVEGRSFGVHNILSVNLAYNEIQSFNFSGLSYEKMHLSNNNISNIEEGSFGEISFISALLLERNNLTSIKRKSFQGIHFISELHLQGNSLQKIEKGSFQNMTIEKLFLFNNSLTTMNGVLDGMKRQPRLLLLFGNPGITSMRTSDYQNMTDHSKMYISCSSIIKFSSPFTIKAELLCSGSNNLVITESTVSLEGNGFYCTRHITLTCHACAPGTFDVSIKHYGQTGCRSCPYGAFYQDEMASIDCKKCPLGQYVPPNRGPGKSPLDCLTCPKGTNTNASAGYRACHCLRGYSRTYRFGACEKCPIGGFQCRKDYPELKAGYWMSWDKTIPCKRSFTSFMTNLNTENDLYDRNANYFNCNLPIAHKCPISNACKGGVDATCTKGYTGVLCAVCDTGYMKQFNKCVECSSPVVSVIECIAYFLSFVILCWLMSKLDNITLVGKDNEKNERTFADLIQSSLKIVMGFYQVLVRIINAFSSIQWPSTLTHAVKVFEFVELSVLRMPSLHCIRSDWRLDAVREFWISLIAMAAIPSLLVTYFTLKASISYYCLSRERFRSRGRISLKNCLQSIVLFFFATYPFISTKIFHVLPAGCQTFCTMKENGHCLNKMSYLRNDYSVICPTEKRGRSFNVYYGYVSLLLPIGLPLLLLYLLWRFAPKRNVDSQPQKNLSIQYEDSQENEEEHYVEWERYNAPLINDEAVNPEEKSVGAFALKMTYGNYKTSCWYWEFIEMIRKLVMVVASSFLLDNVKIGLYSNILLSIVFVVLHARKWPMKDSFDNYMQLLALVSVTVNLCYSVTKTSSIGDADIMDREKDVFGLGVMLVSLNSLLLILIVCRFVKEVALKLAQRCIL